MWKSESLIKIKDRFGISQVEQWLKQIDKERKLSKKVQK